MKEARFKIGDYHWLDNFSAKQIKMNGIIFPTVEHAFQYEKFAFDGADVGQKEAAGKVLSATTPHDARMIAKKYKPIRREDWSEYKVELMDRLFRLAFDQLRVVRETLAKSWGMEIMKAYEDDEFWGIGTGKGQNIIGKQWMTIRDEKEKELREEFPEIFNS